MIRTTKIPTPIKKNMMINYYDANKAQRWGKIEKETKHSFIVSNLFGEKTKVSKENVICEKEGQ